MDELVRAVAVGTRTHNGLISFTQTGMDFSTHLGTGSSAPCVHTHTRTHTHTHTRTHTHARARARPTLRRTPRRQFFRCNLATPVDDCTNPLTTNCISEALYKGQTDALVSGGFLAAGYNG